MSGRGVYVQVFERVSTPLFALTDAVAERLEHGLQDEGMEIARAAAVEMAPHSKSGELLGSLKVRTRRYRSSVWTAIAMGGTRSTRYGHLFERGFSGAESVPTHQSRSRFGTVFTVQDYRRTVTYAPHRSLQGSLDGRRAAVRARVLLATGQGAGDVGLAS